MGGAVTVQTCPGKDFFLLLPRHKIRERERERVKGGLKVSTSITLNPNTVRKNKNTCPFNSDVTHNSVCFLFFLQKISTFPSLSLNLTPFNPGAT